ncbi:hypothetical protein VPNG_04762 [Cytospora leucostoma]|uniref:NadR/Ttd14 AAA domain-containing protein n=1 Tax=Cytospora leucostoma TaxID=1230097 RepID=A0A423XAH0_9PEZI|nr:hypothetical protein VPNG_04762 [Cytospora leucostoma]
MMPPKQPKNIYIIGAQSTGKTTLLNALRAHFDRAPSVSEVDKPQIIEETARIVFKQEGFKFAAVDTLSNFDEYLGILRLILKAQLEAENEALRKSKWFISDRSGLDCLIYAAKYLGHEGAEQLSKTPELAKLKARMQEGRVIVCEPVADWLKDDGSGFRPIPEIKEQWLAVHTEFCELLNGLGLRYEVLPARITSLEERVTFGLSR